jgi:hypothetical protein
MLLLFYDDVVVIVVAVLLLLTTVYQRSLETRINLLYCIYPDSKHRFGKEKKWIYRFKMVYFWLGRYCTNQLISLSEFPVIYGSMLTSSSSSSRSSSGDCRSPLQSRDRDLKKLTFNVNKLGRFEIIEVRFSVLALWSTIGKSKIAFLKKFLSTISINSEVLV